uniref:Uncharacterized protein n=1 Tax=Acrobeloides nanus TaxID=290746 RepID=A0A914CAI6_9BILA
MFLNLFDERIQVAHAICDAGSDRDQNEDDEKSTHEKTIAMGAFLVIFVLAAIGTGVTYGMGYLDPLIEQVKERLDQQDSE